MIFGPYPAVVVEVHDGDTVKVEIDLGFDLRFRTLARLFGCNAPELSTVAGKAARDALVQMLGFAPDKTPRDYVFDVPVTVVSQGWDKYGGRVDASIMYDGKDLTAAMIAAGHAKPWDGKGVKPT